MEGAVGESVQQVVVGQHLIHPASPRADVVLVRLPEHT